MSTAGSATPTGLALTCALLAVACTGTPPKEWAGTRTDSAGVVLMANPEEGMWGREDAWSLVEELRIGSFADDTLYQFGGIGGMAVGSRGEIYVSDSQAHEVRVFSADGVHLRSVGSPGAAPGELGLGATDVLLAPGDTLLVPDRRNRRINRFAPDGTPLASVPLEPEKGRPLRYDLRASGAMAVQVRPVGSQVGPRSDSLDLIMALEPSGTFGDTLLRIPSGGLFQGRGIHYFTPEPVWRITDSLTVIYGINNGYGIRLHGADGTLQRVVTRGLQPKPITNRDIRAFFAYLDRAWLRAGVPPSRLSANHEQVHFAEFLPVFATFHVGPWGSLWVQRVRSPGEMTDEEIERYDFVEDFGAPDWDVFDAEGRFLGTVAMPARFQPRLFVGDCIYGAWRDELDVPFVMRLRVVRP